MLAFDFDFVLVFVFAGALTPCVALCAARRTVPGLADEALPAACASTVAGVFSCRASSIGESFALLELITRRGLFRLAIRALSTLVLEGLSFFFCKKSVIGRVLVVDALEVEPPGRSVADR